MEVGQDAGTADFVAADGFQDAVGGVGHVAVVTVAAGGVR